MSVPLSRAFVSDIEVRADATGRTVHGIVVPFGRTAMVSDGGPRYEEGFERGAFAKTIQERGARVKLLSQHNSRTNPLGRAALLREDATGLYGEFSVSRTSAGDEALELVKDGALDSFSVGFAPIKHVMRGSVTWRTEVGMREASLVTFPAYEGALVGGIRTEDDLTDPEIQAVDALVRSGYTREDAIEFVLAHDLRSTTPEGEPEGAGTSADAAVVDEPTEVTPLDVSNTFRSLRLKAREKGVL